MSPYDFFSRFFPEELYQVIADHTNTYAQHWIESRQPLSEHSRMKLWRATNADEIKAFISIEIAMGLTVTADRADHWSQHWLVGGQFAKIMSYNRYTLLKMCLHFADNTGQKPKDHPDYDPLYKIRIVLDRCVATYLENIIPGKNLSVDESMLKFKGRLYFKQYMPMKPVKWGIKLFALCDAETGAILRFFVYTGKSNNGESGGATKDVVMKLVEPLLGRGHVVYMDNFYTSPDLVAELKLAGTGATGTVRSNRKHLPPNLKNVSLKKGEPAKYWSTDHMTAFAWHDVKRVHVLSSIDNIGTTSVQVHTNKDVSGFRNVDKPKSIVDYNNNMGGVDTFDQLGSYSNYPHRSYKWYQVIYHFCIEAALVNGFIFCKNNDPKLTQRKFRLAVIDSLLETGAYAPHVQARRTSFVSPNVDPPLRLNTRCFLAKFENPKHKPDCRACSDRKSGNRHQTSWYCKTCQVPLCANKCFEVYHSRKDYQSVCKNRA